MSFVVDGKITVNVNSTAIMEKSLILLVDYFLRTYAYLIVGSVLIFINFPVFLLIMIRKELRNSYLILAIVFLNSGFTGISAILIGTKRLIDTANGQQNIDHHKCVLNVPIFLFISEFLSGWSLLINSVERLYVVAFPIYYYIHNKRIAYSLIAIHYGITVIAVTVAATASLIEPSRNISNLCMLNEAYSPKFYKILLELSSFASFSSVIIMVAVVVNLRRNSRTHFLSNNSYSQHLSSFLENQKRYTKTALISCCFTFIFVVVSAVIEHIFKADSSSVSYIIIMICVHTRLLNSFNLVMLFLSRQKDFQYAAIKCFKYLFFGKNQIQPNTTVAFVTRVKHTILK